jgi:thymidylate synthase (FAD)
MYLREMQRIQITYDKLVGEEIPAEDARYVLPNAIDTSLHVKMNFRELMHFCNVRMCWRAQREIRDLANLMAQEVVKIDPALGKYLQSKCDRDGFCSEHNGCGKKPKK